MTKNTMFSLYNSITTLLFVYFILFLHKFFVFFEDLFLIIAFMCFISIVFKLINTMSSAYFAERAAFIRSLYTKLFSRRKEAILKNIKLITIVYKPHNNFITQYSALIYLKLVLAVKVYKEQQLALNNTAAQQLLIDNQKELTKQLRTLNAR